MARMIAHEHNFICSYADAASESFKRSHIGFLKADLFRDADHVERVLKSDRCEFLQLLPSCSVGENTNSEATITQLRDEWYGVGERTPTRFVGSKVLVEDGVEVLSRCRDPRADCWEKCSQPRMPLLSETKVPGTPFFVIPVLGIEPELDRLGIGRCTQLPHQGCYRISRRAPMIEQRPIQVKADCGVVIHLPNL